MQIFENITLLKMKSLMQTPVQYFLEWEQGSICVNSLIGKEISIEMSGYNCLCCGKDKPIFRQGHCKSCFYSSALVGDWIMKPELSKAHLGIEDRDLEYEKQMQLAPHIVYLANTGNVKVGVTRMSQLPTRWIDQGASYALAFLVTPNRYLAGLAEVELKKTISDKTSWQKMLKGEAFFFNLKHELKLIKPMIPEQLRQYLVEQEILKITYPIEKYPTKVKSLNLEKTPQYTGVLNGIKGQYLIFEDDVVFNVRTYEGYKIVLKAQ